MGLTTGTRLGPYEIVGPIGAGGMGEVYRARDTALNRDVAIKVLPETLAGDPDRLARFQREAEALAALNHPNIAHIHGLEKSGGTPAIVMELVDGPTLADRIKAGPIPLDEALPIARQIAEALESAHERGIIHRDLKPANIKVREDGTVKVLDFGLAKALAPDGASAAADAMNSPTLTNRATQMGVILGTATYMAPEQAKGRAVDKRADIWSFGVVLYEMLVGKRPFVGDDVTDVLAAVVRAEPDWSVLPERIPAEITRLLRRCLTKDRRRRLPDVGAAILELDDAIAAPMFVAGQPAAARSALLWFVVGLVTSLTALLLFWTAFRQPMPAPSVSRLAVALDPPRSIQTHGGMMRLSNDGRRFAYESDDGWWWRRFDELAARPLTDFPNGENVAFSPSGTELLMRSGAWAGRISKGYLEGGQVGELVAGVVTTLEWGSDGWVYFNDLDLGLSRVSEDGLTVQALTRPDEGREEVAHFYPRVLENGRGLLFTIRRRRLSDVRGSQVAVLDLSTLKYRVLGDGLMAHYVSPDYIVIGLANGVLMSARFDTTSLTVQSDFVEVLRGVRVRHGLGAALDMALSPNGTLLYAAESDVPSDQFVWVSRSGEPQIIDAEWGGRMVYFALSHSGERVVVDISPHPGAVPNLFWRDLPSGPLHPFSFGEVLDAEPAFGADDSTVTFASPRPGSWDVYEKAVDSGEPAKKILDRPGDINSTQHTPDGRWMVFCEGGDLRALERETERVIDLVVTAYNECQPSLSPDGRWFAYRSNETGSGEVYVRNFANPNGPLHKLSIAGGTRPRWSPTGDEVFFIDGTGMLVAREVSTRDGFQMGDLVSLFGTGDYRARYEVSPDGRRFLMIKPGSRYDPSPPILIQNWSEDLKRLVPVK